MSDAAGGGEEVREAGEGQAGRGAALGGSIQSKSSWGLTAVKSGLFGFFFFFLSAKCKAMKKEPFL